jgi:UDP-2,4-diacetamido-2,4,6-trideoxy-beta-L-altropyranose hydrolase
LAEPLRSQGAEVEFLCQERNGALIPWLRSQGYSVKAFPETASWEEDAKSCLAQLSGKADWLVVDHYDLDSRWEHAMRAKAAKIFTIDDLADRSHDSDILLDQNLYPDLGTRYAGLVPKEAKLLLGTHYALLRPEFSLARASLGPRQGALAKVLIFFSGSDFENETERAILGLRGSPLSRRLQFDVIVGMANPRRKEIEELCARDPAFRFHCQVSNMAERMAEADLAIGGGGTTTWERCCLGLPSLVAILAENQVRLTQAVEAKGALVNLGRTKEFSPGRYAEALEALTAEKLAAMAASGLALVDGQGTGRVVQELLI